MLSQVPLVVLQQTQYAVLLSIVVHPAQVLFGITAPLAGSAFVTCAGTVKLHQVPPSASVPAARTCHASTRQPQAAGSAWP